MEDQLVEFIMCVSYLPRKELYFSKMFIEKLTEKYSASEGLYREIDRDKYNIAGDLRFMLTIGSEKKYFMFNNAFIKYSDPRIISLLKELNFDKTCCLDNAELKIMKIPKKYLTTILSERYYDKLCVDPKIEREISAIARGEMIKENASYWTIQYLSSNLSISQFNNKISIEAFEHLV